MRKRPIIGVVMDAIQGINPKKDTTLALLIEAQKKGCELHYMQIPDLFLRDGQAFAQCAAIEVSADLKNWFSLKPAIARPLDQFDLLLMRKDPPFDIDYLYATYILERAEAAGTVVINKPKSLRDANEKIFASWFPHCMPPTVVTASKTLLKDFAKEHGTVVFKALDSMGGQNVFKCDQNDPNINMICELLTQNEQRYIMAQRFIPEIAEGDKRILLIDGKPIPYALARIPAAGEFRGNLAAGATGVGRELSKRDWWICEEVGPRCRDAGLTFVGIDIIGDYLTEVNVTSPTCVKELEREFSVDIAGQIVDCFMEKLHA